MRAFMFSLDYPRAERGTNRPQPVLCSTNVFSRLSLGSLVFKFMIFYGGGDRWACALTLFFQGDKDRLSQVQPLRLYLDVLGGLEFLFARSKITCF